MSSEFLKLLIIGDSGVGKSCVLSRFCEDKFTQAFYNTIGVDFKTKTMNVDGKPCKLQIWDTAGQERFRTITANYYKGAHGILIVFDLTEKESLQNVTYWLEEIEKHGNLHPPTILIGNKTDREKERKVTEDEGLQFAKEHKLDYIECSALNALNISLVFEAIVKKVLRQRISNEDGLLETPMGHAESPAQRIRKDQSNKSQQSQQNGCC